MKWRGQKPGVVDLEAHLGDHHRVAEVELHVGLLGPGLQQAVRTLASRAVRLEDRNGLQLVLHGSDERTRPARAGARRGRRPAGRGSCWTGPRRSIRMVACAPDPCVRGRGCRAPAALLSGCSSMPVPRRDGDALLIMIAANPTGDEPDGRVARHRLCRRADRLQLKTGADRFRLCFERVGAGTYTFSSPRDPVQGKARGRSTRPASGPLEIAAGTINLCPAQAHPLGRRAGRAAGSASRPSRPTTSGWSPRRSRTTSTSASGSAAPLSGSAPIGPASRMEKDAYPYKITDEARGRPGPHRRSGLGHDAAHGRPRAGQAPGQPGKGRLRRHAHLRDGRVRGRGRGAADAARAARGRPGRRRADRPAALPQSRRAEG